MTDKANDHKFSILLIGDFDIDLCKFQLTWNITTSLFGFDQLVRSTTRITSTTATLIDYIYSNNQTVVSEVLVSTASISDHSPIFCIWSFKLPKRLSKGHTSIEYRSFKNFNVDSFLLDLSTMPFLGVFNYNDPSEALAFWYDAFLPVVNTPQWGAADAEIKVPSGENTELKRSPLKPGVGQHIATHATLTARDFFLAYFYPSGPFTCIFSKTSPDFSCVGCG